MQIEVLTLFPEMVEALVQYGMPRVAVSSGAMRFQAVQIREFADNRHRRVDDRTFGGGPGMVMQAEPMSRALESSRARTGGAKVLALSPQGERWNQALAQRMALEPALIFVCGRYEGLDERLMPQIDLEVSLGDYVMSGGELAAMVMVDTIARLLPGVLGHAESAENDSFSAGLLDHPHYSRPEIWREQAVPEVLMSGNHAAIRRWRLKQALGRTWLKRPDLLDGLKLDAEQLKLLREYIAEQQS